MVYCTYCGQSFTRDEHLERHILTHTNVKPFKCYICHMSFARRDLLQRHYTVHGKDQNQEPLPAANGMIPKSAGRTPIACSNCAKTKTKCDKKFPCSRCAARNLRCTLRPTRRASKNAARLGAAPDGSISSNDIDMTHAKHPDCTHGKGSSLSTDASSMHSSLAPPNTTPSSTVDSVSVSEDSSVPSTTDASSRVYPEQPVNGHVHPKMFSPVIKTPASSNSTYIQHTPVSGLEDFSRTSLDNSDLETSPRFMIDWPQMQIPMNYDSVLSSQILMSPEMAFDPNSLSLGPPTDGMMNMLPDMPLSIGPLISPLVSPKGDHMPYDLGLGNSSSAFFSNRHSSSLASLESSSGSQDSVGDANITAAARQAWSVFRCINPLPLSLCPRTARLNIKRLEQTLRNQDSWSDWSPQLKSSSCMTNDCITLAPMRESSRDKLMAITQSFLYKALKVHGECIPEQPHAVGFQSPDSRSSSPHLVLLPPTRALELLLTSYTNCSERYFPITARGVLDINGLMNSYNERAASLLVLLMIARGAMSVPSTQAHILAAGLIEACRLSLFELVERNIATAADPLILHSGLLLTVQAAWSGDKWQMDVAMSQRGMYFSLLRHAGMLEQQSQQSAAVTTQLDTPQLWNDWIQSEAKSRLVYAWVMVDQDLALFHDTAPMFTATGLEIPMPDSDRLWQAKSDAEWSNVFEQVHEFSGGYSSVGSGARPLSLRDLFRHFLDDEMISLGIEMTPLQLRLLLHPLQSLVCQYSQLLSCFSDLHSNRHENVPRTVSASSTRTRLEEIQSLLQRWYDLAERYLKANHMCAMMQANLIVFHLISLNAVTNFADIERLARREGFDGTYQQLLWLHKRCISDVEEAVFHCGQILRLIRLMSFTVRPLWWSAAVYRVALILWVDSLTHINSPSPNNNKNNNNITTNPAFTVSGPSFAIDALSADHALIIRYLTKREGTPCVTKRDGSQLPIDRAFAVLQHCIEVIEDGPSSCLSDGIRDRLDALARS